MNIASMNRTAVIATLAAATALLFAGCAAPGSAVQPGLTRGAEVVARQGPPVRIWPEADGGRTLEYSSQPYGRQAWMIRLDADDRVVALADGLSQAAREAIEPGMTVEQVGRRLGRERTRQFFRLSGEDVWDWNVEPEMLGHYPRRFNVHFKDGKVVRWTYSTVFPDRRFLLDD